MAGLRRVLDIEFDGSGVTATFGRHEIPALKASYGDSLETEVLRHMGSQRQDARTPGQYKTEQLAITFRNSVFRVRLIPLFPTSGGGNIIVPIVIGFRHPDIGNDSDLLQGARCVNWGAAMEAGSKGLEVETKWDLTQIFWTAARNTINQLNGAVPIGASAF